MLDCSFCIIPSVRPHLASRPPHHILDEVRRLVDNGYREIVLTGIHLGHYGVEWSRARAKSDWFRLSHLLEKLAALGGEFRVRLSSIEATEVTRELVAVMAAHPARICPHLHVSMQSGSDEVLRRMRRRWGSQRFVDRCRQVCESLDRPALTTDVIVGFPGESETDFGETLSLLDQVGYDGVFTFKYSPRPNTPALAMADSLPDQEKARRLAVLMEHQRRIQVENYRRHVGQTLQVMVEGRNEARGQWIGRSSQNKTVNFTAGAGVVLKAGEYRDVYVSRSFPNSLAGEMVV